jgi:hypothetical protein
MGLEGIVSKRLGSRYVSGRTRDWSVATVAEVCFGRSGRMPYISWAG